ncbi:hypothetical protein GCM10018775_91360 [Streptomyces umbrinus]|nr:hypothetical protein GCM10018775_91360 [Streptomyces umbrinus]
MFRLAVPRIKGKRQFGRRDERLVLVLQGYPSMTSEYATGVDGRFLSAFFTTGSIAESAH